jgi:glycosyltransferase involved in cell wall biosynthesis
MGYLRKDRPEDLATIEQLYRDATIFCMPSYWESTGIVYMEAALWGLPVVMLKGQGREEIFPASMAIHVGQFEGAALAEALTDLSRSPDRMQQMGASGRQTVLEKYTWAKVAQRLYQEIQTI